MVVAMEAVTMGAVGTVVVPIGAVLLAAVSTMVPPITVTPMPTLAARISPATFRTTRPTAIQIVALTSAKMVRVISVGKQAAARGGRAHTSQSMAFAR